MPRGCPPALPDAAWPKSNLGRVAVSRDFLGDGRGRFKEADDKLDGGCRIFLP